jgi:hypothetical protein
VRRLARFLIGGLVLGSAALAFAQHSHDSGHGDTRVAVAFPAELKQHTLSNMRGHLKALAEIQGYLAVHDFDRAAEVAEFQLGMSSLGALNKVTQACVACHAGYRLK